MLARQLIQLVIQLESVNQQGLNQTGRMIAQRQIESQAAAHKAIA